MIYDYTFNTGVIIYHFFKRGGVYVNSFYDFLRENTPDMSTIRVRIIEDRKFDIPDWFYNYITDMDICSIIMDFNSSIIIGNKTEFEKLLCNLDKKGCIQNYKSIAVTIYETGEYDLVRCFNQNKLGKKLIRLVDTTEDAIKCINSFIHANRRVPYIYIRMYVITRLDKPIWATNKSNVCESIDSLLRRYSGHEFDLIYPTIYKSHIVYMDNCVMNYSSYVYHGGTWYDSKECPIGIIEYIKLYSHSSLDNPRPMNDNILTDIFEAYPDGKDYESSEAFQHIRTFIILSVTNNIDNVKFIFFPITLKERDMIEYIALESCNSPMTEFKQLVNVLSVNGSYDKLQQLVFKHIKNGIDMSQISSYLQEVVTPNNIGQLLSIISEGQLKDLCMLNPYIREQTSLTFIDVMLNELSNFTSTTLDKIRTVMSSCPELYSRLYSSERYSLYGKNKEFYGMCALYPGIMSDNDSLSVLDVDAIYELNQDSLAYINPAHIKSSLIVEHVKNHGYIKLLDISTIGFEHLISIHQYIKLLKYGNGFGYLVDINSVEYRNICIDFILNM